METRRPKLTIGMAHFDDFDGVYFTIQALRLYHAEAMKDVELVVIDQSPESPAGKMVKGLVEGWAVEGTAGTKYVPFVDRVGTSASRDHVFTVASAPAVMVMDCHVLLHPGSVQRLIDYYDENPETRDIMTGPLVFDNLVNIATHFDDVWRGEMWGIWGSAFECCPGSQPLSARQNEETKAVDFYPVEMGAKPLQACATCGKEFPMLAWAGHEKQLEGSGFKYLGKDPDDEPFEITGHGLGTFTCRRDAWLHFNPHARGFGGEELYIHTKFRQSGAKALLLPFLRWVHRFGRPSGVKYPLTRWNKVRNYVLEFRELGLDNKPIREHFLDTGLMKQETWNHLLANPEANVTEPMACQDCPGGVSNDAIDTAGSVDDLFSALHRSPRDLDKHMPKLRELAIQAGRVTEFTGRRESTVAFAAGAKSVISFNTEQDNALVRLKDLSDIPIDIKVLQSLEVPTIEETDLLFLDQEHTFARLSGELDKFAGSVTRYIVLHDTKIFGDKGEDGGPGILKICQVFMRKNPEWSVVFHTPEQYGLTVMSRDKRDKPELPSTITMAKNLAVAMTKWIAEGAKGVPKEQMEERLLVCSLCDQRTEGRCAVCGCFIEKKAMIKPDGCPIGKWDRDLVEVEGE